MEKVGCGIPNNEEESFNERSKNTTSLIHSFALEDSSSPEVCAALSLPCTVLGFDLIPKHVLQQLTLRLGHGNSLYILMHIPHSASSLDSDHVQKPNSKRGTLS